VKETVNLRRIEFLNATANPIDVEIIGKDGRAAILREVARGLQMDVDEVVPSREKSMYQSRMEAQAMAMAAEQQQAQPQSATPSLPDGSPKGGVEATTVRGPSGRAA
jgi:hypothetical protein